MNPRQFRREQRARAHANPNAADERRARKRAARADRLAGRAPSLDVRARLLVEARTADALEAQRRGRPTVVVPTREEARRELAQPARIRLASATPKYDPEKGKGKHLTKTLASALASLFRPRQVAQPPAVSPAVPRRSNG